LEIHILRARKCPQVIGGIAAPTKAYFVNRIGRRTIMCARQRNAAER
jgi:hypothetical protein